MLAKLGKRSAKVGCPHTQWLGASSMASIVGFFFEATTPNLPVHVVETMGGGVPPPGHRAFNLEVWTGNPADAPTSPAPGYQGLAVLSNSGMQIDLISGAFAVTDHGTGDDTINADGNNQTISGGVANVTLNLLGDNDVANGGGRDTISVFGNFDTVNGVGNDLITVFGNKDSVNGGNGNDTIALFGVHDTITASTGNETIAVFGDNNRVAAGTGNDMIDLLATAILLTKAVETRPSTRSDQAIHLSPVRATR